MNDAPLEGMAFIKFSGVNWRLIDDGQILEIFLNLDERLWFKVVVAFLMSGAKPIFSA